MSCPPTLRLLLCHLALSLRLPLAALRIAPLFILSLLPGPLKISAPDLFKLPHHRLGPLTNEDLPGGQARLVHLVVLDDGSNDVEPMLDPVGDRSGVAEGGPRLGGFVLGEERGTSPEVDLGEAACVDGVTTLYALLCRPGIAQLCRRREGSQLLLLLESASQDLTASSLARSSRVCGSSA